MAQKGFIVDTHLLRELGDLLVGRDSTAVLELIKNGYDADATVVRIDAQNLGRPELARLTVEDNGNGMSAKRFRSAFLRIAGRDKEVGARVSPRFKRAYTGQKGIGRLASQKLAKVLEVVSRPRGNADKPASGVEARIEWEVIDRQDRLDRLTAGLEVNEVAPNLSLPTGTTLTLLELKRSWSSEDIGKFVNELQSLQPPALLLGSDSDALGIAGDSLIGQPVIRRSHASDPGFNLELSGELAPSDDLWIKGAEDFQWCVEIDVAAGRTRYRITPTSSYAQSDPLSRAYSFEAPALDSLRFQARFYMMPGASVRRGPLKGFVRASSGVRVYMEGFRVLPYAEYGDDWLEIDRDYRTGARFYSIDLDTDASDHIDTDEKEALNAVASNGYFGAVFLTSDGAPGLQSLVNREGFVPGPTFESIRRIVQDGVRLSVRVRRSVYNQQKQFLAALRSITAAPPAPKTNAPTPTLPAFGESRRQQYELLSRPISNADSERRIAAAAAAAAELAARGTTDGDDVPAVPLRDLVDGFESARQSLQQVQNLQPELRTLAGVGLQLGAFVHDINSMLASTTTIRELLRAILETVTVARERTDLQVILRSADELAHTLARQSSYLTDVLSADPRRRRSQVIISQRLDSVLRFLAGSIQRKSITVHVSVDPSVRTGPMFPAEMTILLTNLLTNAVKNANQGGNIWIEGLDAGDAVELVITNDGAVVDLEESERWFLPFESTTTSVDEVLGQGMGLGLPIVRALVDDYRGDVRFISPAQTVGTAVRVLLPKKGKLE